jgi:Fur family ferric uptake transcriptional regulator
MSPLRCAAAHRASDSRALARGRRASALDRCEPTPHPLGVRTVRKGAAISADVMNRALERFRSVLHERSLKYSKVREAIARAALSYHGHFSVDDLLRVLHAGGVRDAHMATVYRAVPLLVEAGLIQAALVSKGDGQRYESAFEREHHDHLVCTVCGRVVEYQSEALEALQREIAARYDFELDDHTHELRGRCKDCRRTAVKPVAARQRAQA